MDKNKKDLIGRPLLTGGAAGPQMLFLDKEDYLTLKTREKINAQRDVDDQMRLFSERSKK
tara:strand:- start:223 stop:402 length:180 start_codon:yes stop_codon:yes gene_type:complete